MRAVLATGPVRLAYNETISKSCKSLLLTGNKVHFLLVSVKMFGRYVTCEK